jgi:HD-GYP domain-containing protein (c-di-GMP phosphodiesterase class II)
MTSDRPYRPAMSHAAAMAEIKRNRGVQFDPQIVDAFESAMANPVATPQPERAETAVAVVPAA